MKIGIITMSLLNNYGCVLQNYALQTVLKKIGHDPITLDYIPYKSPFRILLSLVYTIILFFTKRRRPFAECFPIKRDKYVTSFINKNICVTHPLRKYSSSLINEYKLEGFVVGSDQIWRPLYNDDILCDAFLKFTRGYDVKRVAYAASFGVSEWEYTKEETIECSALVQDFDAVSVREITGVDLCKKHLQIEALTVLDPTLLLDAEEYRSLLSEKRKNIKRYILTYILNDSLYKGQFTERLSNEDNCDVINIKLGSHLEYSIEKWLGLFDGAEFVITDSFHGTVFSVLFHKPFYVIDNPSRGSARMLSLLNLVGLENRLIKESSLYGYLNIDKSINWDDVEKKLSGKKEEGFSFLRGALS